MAREINLVPDVKGEMIKALKLRNYIFFASMVIAAASVGMIVVFGLIAGGQQLARDNRNNTIELLSKKLSEYSELSDTITIKDQLNNISTLTSNKQVLSRTFNALTALIPTGADSIQISELTVKLAPGEDDDSFTQPTFSLEAQANAGQEPYIDYNVLDSFKKSMQYMSYDYGTYVDQEGNAIPAYCIIEQGSDGATFKELRDGQENYYGLWTIEGEGCNPSEELKSSDYALEDYEDQKVVRIWRTPQFSDWYKKEAPAKGPYMDLSGMISGVEHFESNCITYSGNTSSSQSSPKWDQSFDESCRLIEDESGETEGIVITESSNGRDSNNELVLRFAATLTVNPEFFKFDNTHMLALAPSGRRNVTDSYVQIQSIFGKRAADCDKNDADCATSNTGTGSDTGNVESDRYSERTSF